MIATPKSSRTTIKPGEAPLRALDITSRSFKADPFPFYARLRAEAPVFQVRLRNRQKPWLITRYDDVVDALKDERLVKSRKSISAGGKRARQPWMPAVVRALEQNMLDTDNPDHNRLRKLVHKAFTPRMITQMEGRIETIANGLLAEVVEKREIDLVADFALPLPLIVIADMLGIPSRDQHKFHRWSHRITNTLPGIGAISALPAVWSLIRYLRGQFRERRLNPKDDLLTALVGAEEAGEQLNEEELMAMGFLLLIAGHETTVNLIASGTLALLQNPEQMEMLKGSPNLIGSAVEELLRYTSPLETATERYAREAFTLHGVTIPKGALVFAVLASANRDERHFEQPDRLDLTRKDNKHLAFGQGIHYCLGAPLARMEGQIALNALLRRLPHLKLAADPASLRWRPTMVLRGLEALPVIRE